MISLYHTNYILLFQFKCIAGITFLWICYRSVNCGNLEKGIHFDFLPGVKRMNHSFINNYDATIYIPNIKLPTSIHDIEVTFSYYGPPRYIKVSPNSPSYALVEFLFQTDAAEALSDVDENGFSKRLLSGYKVYIQRSHRSKITRNKMICFKCGQAGHYGRECDYTGIPIRFSITSEIPAL